LEPKATPSLPNQPQQSAVMLSPFGCTEVNRT
jgi:hypothetical protein